MSREEIMCWVRSLVWSGEYDEEEVADAYHQGGGKNSDYTGHCFYTEQDQEIALEGSGLCIGFGHLWGNDAKGVKAG